MRLVASLIQVLFHPSIEHKDKVIFTEWQPEDLEHLATITQKVLLIHEKARVANTLSLEQRLDMLKEVSDENFPGKGMSYDALSRRNGTKLQGVQHKHSHATGIKYFPITLYEKCMALIRLAWPGRLSEQEMENRIEEYAPYYKDKVD